MGDKGEVIRRESGTSSAHLLSNDSEEVGAETETHGR